MSPRTRYYTLRKRAAQTRRQRLWQAMRIMRQFSVNELLAVCECTGSWRSVHAYLSVLRRAGYVRVTPGDRTRHQPSRYYLVRDTGPHNPSVIHRGTAVWDINTDTEYPL